MSKLTLLSSFILTEAPTGVVTPVQAVQPVQQSHPPQQAPDQIEGENNFEFSGGSILSMKDGYLDGTKYTNSVIAEVDFYFDGNEQALKGYFELEVEYWFEDGDDSFSVDWSSGGGRYTDVSPVACTDVSFHQNEKNFNIMKSPQAGAILQAATAHFTSNVDDLTSMYGDKFLKEVGSDIQDEMRVQSDPHY